MPTTIDPTFTIEDAETGIDATTAQMVGVLVTKNTSIDLAITDPSGIEGAEWSVIGLSGNFSSPTITPGGVPSGVTATLTVPNSDGIAVGVLCRARANGVYVNAIGKFYTARPDGLEPFFDGETSWGWKLNEVLDEHSSDIASLETAVGQLTADMKDSVRVATTGNITLSGAQTIDGVSVIAGEDVLVKNQSSGAQNGIYTCAAGAWARRDDADTSAKMTSGVLVKIAEGTQGGQVWSLDTLDPIVLGTTVLVWGQKTWSEPLLINSGNVMAGQLRMGGNAINTLGYVGSTATVAANQDNYLPTDFANADRVELTPTGADRQITGFDVTGLTASRKWIYNASATLNLLLRHDTTSTASNRFVTPGNQDFTLGPQSGVLIDRGTDSRWHLIGTTSLDPLNILTDDGSLDESLAAMVRHDGTVVMTGNLDVGGYGLLNPGGFQNAVDDPTFTNNILPGFTTVDISVASSAASAEKLDVSIGQKTLAQVGYNITAWNADGSLVYIRRGSAQAGRGTGNITILDPGTDAYLLNGFTGADSAIALKGGDSTKLAVSVTGATGVATHWSIRIWVQEDPFVTF